LAAVLKQKSNGIVVSKVEVVIVIVVAVISSCYYYKSRAIAGTTARCAQIIM